MWRIRVLSFDLEGTLVYDDFSRLVWEEGLPAHYAEEKGISLESALKRVIGEYDEISPERVEWYDLRYWFRRFGLRGDPRSLLERFRDSITIYPEVRGVLESLRRDHDMIIVSNTSRDFLDLLIEGLKPYFKAVFSAPSDFETVKSPSLFTQICSELGVKPQEVVHMGDSRRFDLMAPREAGITSFLLNRTRRESGEYIVQDLEEFEQRLLALKDQTL